MTSILLLDNYDSFTGSLIHLLKQCDLSIVTVLNDQASVAELLALKPGGVIIGPGPGEPKNAGQTLPLLSACIGRIPTLGICLGQQAIALHFGAVLSKVGELRHGKSAAIEHDGKGLFANLPSQFDAGCYNSLTVSAAKLPTELEISARAGNDEVMGLRVRELGVDSIQFHPESILTPVGAQLISNWTRSVARRTT